MSKKTIFIFIIVFILVGAIMLGIYFFSSSSNTATNTQNTNGVGYQSFNPFGSGTQVTPTNNNQNTTSGNQTTVTPTTNTTVSKFHKITDSAIAGATFFEDTRPITTPTTVTPDTTNITPTTDTSKPLSTTKTTSKTSSKITIPKPFVPTFETVPSLRYVERINGHIYQMYLDTKAINEVSNSTIPNIYETFFDGTAKSVIYRYVSTEDNNTISSYMATLGGSQGQFLPSNITDISVSPDKTRFFYLIENKNGVSGSIRSFTDTKINQVFSSPFTEWLSQWVGSQKIFLTTKASFSVNGDLFSLNTSNGSLNKIMGGIKGLTTLVNKDGTQVLYGVSSDTGPKLGIYDISKNTYNDINAYGLPEKCVWNNDGSTVYCAIPNFINGTQYPDSWYQGLVSFNDHFVKIDTKTLQTTQIDNEGGVFLLDGTHLFLDDKESQLFFTNKKDSTLWSLDLK